MQCGLRRLKMYKEYQPCPFEVHLRRSQKGVKFGQVAAADNGHDSLQGP